MADIRIDQLADEIVSAVREYTEDVTEGIEQELNETSKTVLKDIKDGSPVNTGEYKKGWKRKKESSNGRVVYTIHNKNKPSLTHLLEFGHAKRGGGRVAGIPHIRPASDLQISNMMVRIDAIIRNGGRRL